MATGSALLAATGAIHLHLWAMGYRNIPTIGPLFLLQGIVGAVLAVLLLATRRLVLVAVSVGFMLATIGGYALSIYVGLFGFKDTLAAPFGGVSLLVESAGAVVAAAVGVALVHGHLSGGSRKEPVPEAIQLRSEGAPSTEVA